MDQPTRYPWNNFPDVLIHASEQQVKQHSSYLQAKAGDAIASARLTLDLLAKDVAGVWQIRRFLRGEWNLAYTMY